MSFFQILDVITNSGQRNRLGGPNGLSGSSQYDRNTYRFPLDVGNYDKGHYILFNINQQTKTQFSGSVTNDLPTVIKNMMDLQARRGVTNIGGTVQQGIAAGGAMVNDLKSQFGDSGIVAGISGVLEKTVGAIEGTTIGKALSDGTSGAIGSAAQMINNVNGTSFLRTIQRTTDTIALYMPDTLTFNYSQHYETPALSDGIASLAAAGASAVMEGSKKNAEQVGKNLSPFFMNYLSKLPIFGKAGGAVFTAGSGLVQNPMMEVIYSSPKFRNFSFTFMFYPRSEAEALEVQKILDRFRFHQAPEIKSSAGGYFLIPPSEFDITFMYNGKINPNIDKISTCVLDSISVDYAKNGFTTYEVEGENDARLGRTGMPVGIGLTLSFKETQILTKEYYRADTTYATRSYFQNADPNMDNRDVGSNN